MAAGLGFKTFTVGEVLTAGDTNGYLMQGVLVFASAAARDAAITSPQEGQFAYLKDTNVTTYYTGSAWANLDTTGMTNPMTTTGDTIYSSSGSTPARLGIGSTGDVLTVAGGVPSWAAPATPSTAENWTLLNTGGTALTGSATITISGITGQNKLWVMINAASIVNSGGYLSVLINNDNTAKYATQGRNDVPQATYSASSFGATGSNLNVASNFEVAGWANNADSTARVSMMINGANSSGAKIVNSISGVAPGSGANPRHYAFQGVYTGSSTISSLVFKSDNGNFDAGTVYVYGSAN
jgi:hypothetical protein